MANLFRFIDIVAPFHSKKRYKVALLSAILVLLSLALLRQLVPSNRQSVYAQEVHHESLVHSSEDADVATETRRVPISRQVHQSWKTRRLPSARASRWSESWRRCFPDWRYRLWTDADNLRLVRRHYPWLLDTYLGLRRPVERADLARYLYLHRHGGIYVDLDSLCLKNFVELFNSASIVLAGMDYAQNRPWETVQGIYVPNSLMASRPGHPFWLQLAWRAAQEFKKFSALEKLDKRKSSQLRPEHITGPLMLLQELRRHIRKHGGVKRKDGAVLSGDLLILPGRYLNPFSWSVNRNPANCRDLGNLTLHQEWLCAASFPDAYAVQFHTQSWLHGHF